MRDHFDLGPEQHEDINAAIRAGSRRAAVKLSEDALPAPCVCNPKTRCDRHCRVKIRLRVDDDSRAWVAECDGGGRHDHIFGHGDSRVWCLLLPPLHTLATEHIAAHRARAAGHG